MVLGVGLIVIGYAIFYWGLHHLPNVDCPNKNKNTCRYSLPQILGLDKYLSSSPPIQYGPKGIQ